MMNLFTVMGLRGKEKPKSLWFEQYRSAVSLTEDQKIFLSYYTEEGMLSVLGYDWLLNRRYKSYVIEAVKAIEHFINTGEKVHFYMYGQQTNAEKIIELQKRIETDYISAVKALENSEWCVDLAIKYIKDTAILRTGK